MLLIRCENIVEFAIREYEKKTLIAGNVVKRGKNFNKLM